MNCTFVHHADAVVGDFVHYSVLLICSLGLYICASQQCMHPFHSETFRVLDREGGPGRGRNR
jgi:hypothetical protein